MASRFWTQGVSDLEEEEQSDYDEEIEIATVESAVTQGNKITYYLQGNAIDSDDEDAHKRVVKSTKDKRFNEIAYKERLLIKWNELPMRMEELPAFGIPLLMLGLHMVEMVM
ncbi:eukaryotic translation initiation factor 3 subunit C-like [Vicia villosa]|uniref:eukaryotic translation initiation factor 3 subunit C-like n=1 Tax=Vicia villosa TaxID=3911 RepID=UPI00273C114C|nr:eukaryotic translation initiation factor 3 subunit C-like [Vicia villosa]XP_058752253.1 eukaryotic translation initiation factor 3 subunit C-like [Vicia villosa]